jgi:hypothetical protein
MSDHKILKTILRADGKRRVLILQRDDGLYGFREESGYDSPQGKRWAALAPHATICDTIDHAENEARSSIDWLISNQ